MMLLVQPTRFIRSLPIFNHRRYFFLQSCRAVVASTATTVGIPHQRGQHDKYNGSKSRQVHSTICSLNQSKNSENNLVDNTTIHAADSSSVVSDTLPESFTDVPGATNTKSKTLAIIYTCKVCNTRSAKQFTEQAYRHGVVLVRCPGCENLHLISDRLGWFEDKGEDGGGWDVEKALAKAGEKVKAISHDNVLELTLDDVAGTTAQ